MSRSRKKTPIIGNACSNSEKFYKRYRAHQERVRERSLIQTMDVEQLTWELVPWDEWSTGRDGKRYGADLDPKHLRK